MSPRQKTRGFALGELDLQGHGDRLCDFILNLEDVGDVPVVTLGPKVGTRPTVHQLRGDAHAVSRTPNTAFEHMAHAEVPRNYLYAHGAPLIHERRTPRDNENAPQFRQLGDDVFGDAVREMLLLSVARHVDEGQDGNRRLLREAQFQVRRASQLFGQRLGPANCNAVDAHRIGDVFELPFTKVFEGEIELALHLLMNCARDTNVTAFG